MTRDEKRDEILGMSDMELYLAVHKVVYPLLETPVLRIAYDPTIREALWWCYQAEEKIKEMGKKMILWSN